MGIQRHVPAALPPGKTRYPLYRRLGGLQGQYGRVRKLSSSPGFDARTVQPVASRYTDWYIIGNVCINCSHRGAESPLGQRAPKQKYIKICCGSFPIGYCSSEDAILTVLRVKLLVMRRVSNCLLMPTRKVWTNTEKRLQDKVMPQWIFYENIISLIRMVTRKRYKVQLVTYVLLC
jgi:hypothetical protein